MKIDDFGTNSHSELKIPSILPNELSSFDSWIIILFHLLRCVTECKGESYFYVRFEVEVMADGNR